MEMFIAIIIIAVVNFIFWDWFNIKRVDEKLRKTGVTGPPAIPVLGNLFDVVNSDPSSKCE